MDFFYDSQIRRYLLQFMRIFADLKVQTAPDETGTTTEISVPIRYGDLSRQVASIIANNSENTIIPSPLMSATIKEIALYPEMRHNPHHESQIQVDERKFDASTGEYTEQMGNRYSIMRYMPVPYKLTFQLDIYTTNTTTKLQLLEQIMTIFNPAVEIQQNSNAVDWTCMMRVELTGITWTNRSIPQGANSDRDVATLTFEVPVWINPPAKVKKRRVIEQIVANVYKFNQEELDNIEQIDRFILDPIKSCFEQYEQIIVTPGNHKVRIGTEGLAHNQLKLLDYTGSDTDLSWEQLLLKYGEYREGVSYITLKTHSDIESNDGDIIGKIYLTNDPSILRFEIDRDTLPFNDKGIIDQVINPVKRWPGEGLPLPAVGQRYLLIEDLPEYTGSSPWGSVQARENDIISFNGTSWVVDFRASDNQGTTWYVSSLSKHFHYTFNGVDWVNTYFAEYAPGYWRLSL